MTGGGARQRRQRSSPPPGAADEPKLLRICGLAAVRALFERDPGRVERLFFEPRLSGNVGDFCAALARARKPYREVDAAELARVAGTILHGGIAAIARPQPLAPFSAAAASRWAWDGRPIVMLDGIGNPHNLGAIVRTAAFFGIERMILADRPEQARPSDASYRVAEGGFEFVTLYRTALPAALSELRRGYRVIGAVAGRGEPVARVPGGGEKPFVLALGNEEHGLHPATLAGCHDIVTIPGSGRVQSLNVAAAAAILIYAVTRR